MTSAKDLYYVPQVHLLTSDRSKVEFGGVVHFREESNKNMMFISLTKLFEGMIGHPAPSKISEDQIPFFMKQLQQSPSLPLYDQEVQQMITASTPWKFTDLERYVEKVKKI